MGTPYNRLAEVVLTSTYNLCFEQKCEKYQSFLSEIFQFLEVKFSIYLNRCVFIMASHSVTILCSFFYRVAIKTSTCIHNPAQMIFYTKKY